MRAKILELRQKRVDLVAKARALHATATGEKRDLSSDEQSQWDRMMEDVDALKKQIDNLEKQVGAESDSDDDEAEIARAAAEDEDEDEERDDEDTEDEERARKKFGKTAVKRGKPVRGTAAVRPPWQNERDFRNVQRRNRPEYRAVYVNYLLNGTTAINQGIASRAIQADVDIVGGYLVAPQEFTATLIKFVDNLVFIRQKATKFTVASAQSLGAPSLDTDVSDSDWTSELATGNEDSSMLFGKRELTPHPLAKRLKVSNKLLRAASISGTASQSGPVGNGPEALVNNRLGYKFGVTEEKAFLTGTGAQQPLGLFTASSRGISTGRDVQTGSQTSILADSLITALYTLKPQYQTTAEWLFHRDAMSIIRKLKDGMGQYLWAPGIAGSAPDTVLNRPVCQSEYAPNTFTSGLYVGMIGDFSYYWIADAEQMVIQRLVELYAEANQIGFIARLELDGMPVLEEAFVRLITN